MGFSFNSNSLGLRGPEKENANAVVMGTSFAMGFGVNNGSNWWDSTTSSDYLNLGLPVGSRQQLNLLTNLYKGSFQHLVILFHPNFLSLDAIYKEWQPNKETIFECRKWVTGYLQCFYKSIKWKSKRRHLYKTGVYIPITHGNKIYELNTCYSLIPEKTIKDSISYSSLYWNEIASKFEKITIVRLRPKEDVVDSSIPAIQKLQKVYQQYWDLFLTSFTKNVINVNAEGYVLSDYHELDSHWNVNGNKKLTSLMNQILAE